MATIFVGIETLSRLSIFRSMPNTNRSVFALANLNCHFHLRFSPIDGGRERMEAVENVQLRNRSRTFFIMIIQSHRKKSEAKVVVYLKKHRQT